MICKAAGVLLLLMSGCYVSAAVSRFERRRLQVLDGYISLLYYVKGQIDCYAMPLSDILRRADPSLLAACRGGEARAEASADGGPLTVMIRESRLYLEPESERLLLTWAGELGATYRAEQVARCDYYVEALTAERRKLYDALPARLRTTAALCLCATVAAALLLW